MSLLLFSSSRKGAGQKLQKLVEALFPIQELEICRTISSLSAKLCQPRHDVDVVILLATSKDQLSELLSICDLLDGLRIILVLPDRERDTIAKGHTLRPRFLTYTDDDFLDVGAVLNKMLATTNKGAATETSTHEVSRLAGF